MTVSFIIVESGGALADMLNVDNPTTSDDPLVTESRIGVVPTAPDSVVESFELTHPDIFSDVSETFSKLDIEIAVDSQSIRAVA